MKKTTSALLVFVMLLFMFTACGKDTSPTTPKTQPSQNEVTDSTAQTSDLNIPPYDAYNQPLTLTCKVSGEYSIDEYDSLQYWKVVYFSNRRFSYVDIYVLFATKDEAKRFAENKNAELTDNGYIVKITSENGWEKYTRQEVLDNVTKWPMAVIDKQDGAYIPCDHFEEIKAQYNLP